jgi:hypothetical protein
MTKFSIIISQGGMHLTSRIATISQKFMDKEERKNFLITMFVCLPARIWQPSGAASWN